jgi:hypothetical protein
MEGGLPRLDWRENREREGDTARGLKKAGDWELASSVCACVLEKEKKRGPRGALWMQLPPADIAQHVEFLYLARVVLFFVSTEIRKRIHEPIVMTVTNVKR